MKVYVQPADEGWICDQLVKDWKDYNADMSTDRVEDAHVVWLLADWRWTEIPYQHLVAKKVVTTVHHIVPEKFDKKAKWDFERRDQITDVYHVYNRTTYDFVSQLTTKKIVMITYWANQHLWKKSDLPKWKLQEKHRLSNDSYVIGTFQRDTEGRDLRSPKLEKGPDLLFDAIVKLRETKPNIYVLLAGWRRQFIIGKLAEQSIPFAYFERTDQAQISEFYQCLDLYPVTARVEGGPQSLIEGGLLGVPMVSRDIGIASQVLPASAISDDVTTAIPWIPDVSSMLLPGAFEAYRRLFENTYYGT